MELVFTTPGLLWLLPLAALPVVFHIHARTKERAVDFPGAFFLLNPALPSAERRRQLEDMALLILRVLLIAAAILALSGPRVKGWSVPPSREDDNAGNEAILLVLDDSPSLSRSHMTTAPDWNESLGRMAGILALNHRRRVGLETASGTGWALDDASTFADRLRKTTLDTCVSGDRTLALTRAFDQLRHQPEERRAIILFSDLHRNEAEGQNEDPLARWTTALRAFATADAPALIVVAPDGLPQLQWGLDVVNAGRTAAAAERMPVAGQPFHLRLRARCVSGAGRRILRVDTAPWRFDENDTRENMAPRQILERPLMLAENEVCEVDLPLLQAEPSALWINAHFVEPDEWPYDDAVETAIQVRPKRRAALWDTRRTRPKPETDLAWQATLFALDPLAGADSGRANLIGTALPDPSVATPGSLVTILYDPTGPVLDQAVSERLRGAVERGACVLWLPDLCGHPQEWPKPLPNRVVSSDPLMPRALEGAEVKEGPPRDAWRIAETQSTHPLLRPFAGGRNGDLTGVCLQRRIRLALTPQTASDTSTHDEMILARFNDGLPALVVKRIGSGWACQMAMGLEPNGGLADSAAWPVLLSEFLELAAEEGLSLDLGTQRVGENGTPWPITALERPRTARLAGPWLAKPGELQTPPVHRWDLEIPAGSNELLLPPLPETGLYRFSIPDLGAQRFIECRVALEESSTQTLPSEVRTALDEAARRSGGSVVHSVQELAGALAQLQPGRPLAPYGWILFILAMLVELFVLIWRGRSG